MDHLEVDGTVIEYEVYGFGEPVLLVHLSVLADGLVKPLLSPPELISGLRPI